MAYAPQLDEAIRLIDREDKAGAQRVLARYLQSTPRDEYAWLWLAYILPSRAQQQQALQQCLKFFPGSNKAQHNLDSIRLGIPLERPNLPPDTPPHAYSSFFGRDLYVPGSGNQDKTQPELLDETESADEPDAEIALPAFVSEPATGFEPRLVYPAPAANPVTDSDWVHEETPVISSTSELIAPPAINYFNDSSASPNRTKNVRQKKAVFTPWQVGCLSLLVLAILALLCGGSYYIFSSTPFSNVVTCFEAVLANEFPCQDCPPVAQTCPECPEAVTCPPTPLPPPSPTPTFTPLPEATATPTATPTPIQPVGAAYSLPAPLYFLSEVAANTQIWRLEPDGSGLAPITEETAPITAFDVSPTDGQLAFISNNSLILSRADGSDRRTLVTGEMLPGVDDPEYWSILLSHPLWSPDGTRIAFAQDGIQILNPLTNQIQDLKPNLYSPTNPSQSQIYIPLAWSPDGTRLAVLVSRASCSYIGFLSLDGTATSALSALPQGNPLWQTDGSALLVANPLTDCACSYGPGLYQVDPLTGTSQVILGGLVSEAAPSAFVGWPKFMPDGTLLYFYGELPGPTCAPNWPGNTLMNMVVGVGERWELRMTLHPGSYIIGEALWSADGSLAVIRDQTRETQSRYGPLVIIYSDGRPAIDLPVTGRSLHWGMTTP